MTAPRQLACAVVLLAIAGQTSTAEADNDEASAHVQAVVGMVRTSERGAVGLGPLLGLGGRFTLARSDAWAFEAQATGLRGAPHLDTVTIITGGVPSTGTLDRVFLGGRLELGAHLRLNVLPWIPTVRGAIGVQARWSGATSLRNDAGDALASLGATSSTDLTAALALGLDRRVGRSLMIGASVGVVHAFPLAGDGGGFDAVELTAHVGWYFYPGWLPLAGWLGSSGGDE